jgi:hypothetical protein
MKKIVNSVFTMFSLSTLLVLNGCGGDSANTQVDVNIMTEEEVEDSDNVFYALPSPFEVASLLRASGVEYNVNVLNSPDKVANYSTTQSKAINLGVYGADLSISTIFDKTQETMTYMKAIKQLADEIGLTAAFDVKTMERIDLSKDNPDSLQRIVADAYMMANSYLKENARSSAASFILAGGWIEGVHIATSLVDFSKPNPELDVLIADQRYSIENLIAMLAAHKDETGVPEIIQDFEELQKLFEQIEEKQVEETSASKSGGNKMVIGGETTVEFPIGLMEKIISKVNEIRTKFVG